MVTNHTLLIAGSQRQYIYKITIQKTTQIRFHSKRPHTISKISMFPYTSICVWNFCVIVLSTSMYSRCIICGSGTAYPSGALEFTLGLSEVRVTRSLVLCVCFVNRSLSFGHCVVCSSSIYGFWLPLWYLQTLLMFIYVLFLFIN